MCLAPPSPRHTKTRACVPREQQIKTAAHAPVCWRICCFRCAVSLLELSSVYQPCLLALCALQSFGAWSCLPCPGCCCLAGRPNATSPVCSHLFVEHDKPEHHYLDLELSSTTGDHNYIKANEKFWSVAIRGGGGPVLVRRHDQHGKITSDAGTLNGHKGECFLMFAASWVGNRLSHHANSSLQGAPLRLLLRSDCACYMRSFL